MRLTTVVDLNEVEDRIRRIELKPFEIDAAGRNVV